MLAKIVRLSANQAISIADLQVRRAYIGHVVAVDSEAAQIIAERLAAEYFQKFARDFEIAVFFGIAYRQCGCWLLM
jgi:hypothetical protein